MRKISSTVMIIVLFLMGCTNNEDKPIVMSEMHKTQGVPVITQTIVPQHFDIENTYPVTVSGIKETQVNSKLSDQIVRVLVKVGDSVEQNQIIIDFPQDNPNVSFYQIKANYEQAEHIYERNRELYDSGGISRQELELAETQYKIQKANWDVAQQTVHVRAPFAGVITELPVREMQNVNVGDHLFSIAQLDRLHGSIWILEKDIKAINDKTEVMFKYNGTTKKARITSIALALNRTYNAFAVDVEIVNSDYSINTGVMGNIILTMYKNEKAIVIPRSIVQRDSKGTHYVYISEDNISLRRDITISNESELNYEISEGLNVGDNIIIKGFQMVTDGGKINNQ